MRSALLPLLLVLSGCAAMQRSWEYSASPVESSVARVEVDEVIVRQKDLRVELRLRVDRGGTLRLGEPRIRLDGEQDLEGRVSVWEGSIAQWARPIEEAVLNPGATVTLRAWFHTPVTDLRRNPHYTLELGALTLDGVPLELPPITLTAPPEAPMGR